MRKILLGVAFLLTWANAYAGLSLNPGPVFGSNGTVPVTGQVGFTIQQNYSAVNVPNNTTTALATFSLTPGIWAIWGAATFSATGASITNVQVGASTSTASTGFAPTILGGLTFGAGAQVAIPASPIIVTVTVTTSYYLISYCVFTGGTVAATGTGYAQLRG